jgi:hypothetical protein
MTVGGVTLNPPERTQRLSGERIGEIGQAAAAMPGDVPVAGWLGDLCADLLDARAMLDARDVEIERLEDAITTSDAALAREEGRVSQLEAHLAGFSGRLSDPTERACLACGSTGDDACPLFAKGTP